MRCSIAICTRNGELFLEEQLASFLHQERKPDEIVICDDASSDATLSIIDSFVSHAASLGIECQVHRHPSPLGVTGNFEFACKQATGDIIFLSDQDDRWHPNKITRMFDAFADPEVMLVNSDAKLVNDAGITLDDKLFDRLQIDGRERRALTQGDLAKVGAYKNLFTGATMAFRSGLRDAALPFCRHVHHDDWLAQIAWISGGRIQTVFEPLMDYRLHSSNTVGLGRSGESNANLSSSERVSNYLEKQLLRLTPVVERGDALPSKSNLSIARLRMRKRQLDLVRHRLAYSVNPFVRAGQICSTLSGGLYAGIYDPVRTAFLDLFRVASKRQAT